MGNETLNTESFEYYRVRQAELMAEIGLKRVFRSGLFWQLTAGYRQIDLENTADRIISSGDISVREGLLNNQPYLFGSALLATQNANHPTYPTQGVNFTLRATYLEHLEESIRPFRFTGLMSFYLNLDPNERVVYATEFGYGFVNGRYDFYHSQTLGGFRSLRGLRSDRLAGDRMLYQSNDLRIRLGSVFNSVIPFEVGITASADFGRVWLGGEDSDRWHSSFGGDLWFNLVDQAVVRIGYHKSSDDGRVLFGLGFPF